MSEAFYAEQQPTPVNAPQLIKVNRELAAELGISTEWLESEQGIAAMAGNYLPVGAEPVAAAYAGHQFGGWNPQLGDGRAILLGEVRGPAEQLYDIQLKGSGRTPWSRGGDGRSPLGPVLREYIVSEAMAALGVPSSRSLAAVTTGESVYREQTLPGAVLCRVARSHIRIGSFQYFAARKNNEALLELANYVIQRHVPEAAEQDEPILALLHFCIEQQAKLVSKWQSFGFIHGVMNTDNMLLGGETIDYGPCAFMDEFKSDKVFSSIDQQGRYAYCNQPGIAHWNLAQLAQCLLPLLHEEQDHAVQLAQKAIDTFPDLYSEQYLLAMRNKLGLNTAAEHEQADAELISDLFTAMETAGLDFTLTFRYLTEHFEDFQNPAALSNNTDERLKAQKEKIGKGLASWLPNWQQRLAKITPAHIERAQTMMRSSNPAIIPRNHLLEQAINEATEQQDFSLFEQLNTALSKPFDLDGYPVEFTLPPLPEQVVQRTFCGT